MNTKKPVIPIRVWFSLTGICNNSCSWCYRSGSEIPVFLDVDVIKKAAETLRKAGTKRCTVIGGEPSLHKEYESIVNYLATEQNFMVSFITNGRVLARKFPSSWIGNKNIRAIVSLHGANSEHYLENTGRPKGFEEAISAIRVLNANGLTHAVNVVLGKENINHIIEFIELAKRENVKLTFTMGMPSIDDPNHEVNPATYTEAIRIINGYCKQKQQHHCFIFSLPWCAIEEELLDNLVEEGNLFFNCPVDKGLGIVIKEDGAITVCTHLSNMDIASSTEAESIFTDTSSFTEFWNSKKLSSLRETVSVYRSSECIECKYRFYCKGGCPLWWNKFDFRPIINCRRKKGEQNDCTT